MILYILVCLVLAVLIGGAYYAYRISFYSPMEGRDTIKPVTNPNYEPYRPEMRRIFQTLKDRPCEFVTITSYDGLTLSGRYYHCRDGAPLDIGFHGYRSSPLVDFSGGSELSLQLGHNLLLIDQRAHGKSQGRTICFGIKERLDLQKWVEYAVERFGKDVKIMLYGVSMGGATVLMASSLPLPQNVKGIVADCPYSNAMDVILETAKEMPIPQFLVKPFVTLGAKLFGGFDINEIDAAQAVKDTKVPILIIHGDSDTLVPAGMSEVPAKTNPKMVSRFLISGAEHGISYLVDTERYHQLVIDFCEKLLN